MIYIESQSEVTALWGELLAEKLRARHVCFNCNELFRGPKKYYEENINFIRFICGCGGFTQGFKQAGYSPVLGVDMWQDATKTYKYNFPESAVINEDITKLTAKDLLDASCVEANDIDVIIGGPPCQGFSISGKRMIDDPRNVLYKSFVQFVGEIRPKVS